MLINHQAVSQIVDDGQSADSAESDVIVNSVSITSSQQRRNQVLNIQFNPSEYGGLTQFEEVEQIYKMRLSPTIVTLVHGADPEKVSPTLVNKSFYLFRISSKRSYKKTNFSVRTS
jgi:hypothetical protein